MKLFQFPQIKLGWNVKNDWNRIKKISDTEMYLFIEKGLGGKDTGKQMTNT